MINIKIIQYNHNKLFQYSSLIKKFHVKNLDNCANEYVNKDKMNNLTLFINFFVNYHIILTRNIWMKKNLVNKTFDYMCNLIWKQYVNWKIALLHAIIILFNKYNDLNYKYKNLKSIFESEIIMLMFFILFEFIFERKNYIYRQFSLTLIYIIIVHKNQNMTFEKIILNIKDHNFVFDVIYIVILHVKSLDEILFERYFNYNHFDHSVDR